MPSKRVNLPGLQLNIMTKTLHVDVLIVGAGLSGVASAYHLRKQCPGKSFALLDAHESFGGTWHLHRYPGARSDSDLYTFGYRFKPWTGNPIANRDQILAYMGEVIEENDLARHIHYGHRVLSASWDSASSLWTLTAEVIATGEQRQFTANFLWMCQGYYRHEQGYTPDWPGFADFKGEVIHPQHWPENANYAGKRVIVIGSGATAATLIPNMARDCAKLTMLQRSPAYFNHARNINAMADELRRLEIDESWIHEIVRRKVVRDRADFAALAQANPQKVREDLINGVRASLGPDFDVDKHFTPRYMPWQQRVAFVPDGDLFQVIREGHVDVVTDEIERFTESGVLLKSGQLIEADLIITATGFNLAALGDIAFAVDGQPVRYADTTTYRGLMFTGIPNMALVLGYGRFSWTLRADLIGDFVCRLLQHMDERGLKQVAVVNREDEPVSTPIKTSTAPPFNPGYLLRNAHLFPKVSKHGDWQRSDDYLVESAEFPHIDLNSPSFSFA